MIDREEVFERKCDEDSRCDRTVEDRWNGKERQDVRESEVLYANR